MPTDQIEGKAREILESGELIATFNGAFDFGCLLEHCPDLRPLIFQAYEESRVHDVLIQHRIGDVNAGRPAQFHNLETLSARYGVGALNKADSPRLEYARLLGRPLSEYSEAERHYAIKDAASTLACYRKGPTPPPEAIASETRHALWLHLCAAWGVRTDPERAKGLRAIAEKHVEGLRVEAQANGFVRESGSKDMKAIKNAVFEAYEGRPPTTKTGQKKLREGATPDASFRLQYCATNKIALEDSGDPRLVSFAAWGEWRAVINKDLEVLEFGARHPIHTRYGMADTTRTTSSGPNMQNWRRLEGVRECFIPRPGHCFGFIDVGGLELGTFAQVLIWELNDRHMADMINEGKDLHRLAAAKLLGVSYEDAPDRPEYKETRQLCKAPNFGYPGGMAAKTLIPFARGMGIPVEESQAEMLKRNWERTFPAGPRYLKHMRRKKNRKTGLYDFTIPGSPGIVRRGATYCSACNGHFQGLGAQAMKQAGWEIMRESWLDRTSPLYGIPMVVFIHDEFGFEIPIGKQHAVMERAREIMVRVLGRMLPDVKLDAEPVAMAYWAKAAKTLRNEKGELEIWNV